jgi:hypothetical protein
MRINKNIAISENGFLFNPTTGEPFSVNPIGAEIIMLLKEGKSLEMIAKQLHNEYHIDEATLEKDIADFIGILKTYSLTEEGDEN